MQLVLCVRPAIARVDHASFMRAGYALVQSMAICKSQACKWQRLGFHEIFLKASTAQGLLQPRVARAGFSLSKACSRCEAGKALTGVGAHEGRMSALLLAAVALCAIMAGEEAAGVSAKPEPLVEHKGTLIKYAGGPMNTAFVSGTPGAPPLQACAVPYREASYRCTGTLLAGLPTAGAWCRAAQACQQSKA